MPKRDIVRQIREFNAGRDPVRLQIKYRIMRDSAFGFLRGTAHLFWGDLASLSLPKSPTAWVCGDLHLENFGCYKGENRLTYFDLNDFDEAALGPCVLDPLRLLASMLVAAGAAGSSQARKRALSGVFLAAYAHQLGCGKSRWIERETATGMVGELLARANSRARKAFLDARCNIKGNERRLALRERKSFPVTAKQRRQVMKFMREFAAEQANPKFFRPLDVVNRIAGTGSLGVDRYAILVEGHGSPDRNHLLDLKEAMPSALAPHLKRRQPKWTSEAGRVVTVQRRVQAVSPAHLQAVTMNDRPYILRALQPTEDRLTFSNWQTQSNELDLALVNMGELVAWGQLRATGRGGSAIADELCEFAAGSHWKKELIEAATQSARRVEKDWRRYAEAFDDGVFD